MRTWTQIQVSDELIQSYGRSLLLERRFLPVDMERLVKGFFIVLLAVVVIVILLVVITSLSTDSGASFVYDGF